MKYILQVSTGAWRGSCEDPDTVIAGLDRISAMIPVSSVIIGWHMDASVYQKVGAFLRSRGIEMILWLPVFSEINAVSEPDMALDLFGNLVPGPRGQSGGEFVFCCPSSRRNLQIVKDLYEDHFSACGFTGVFLDRIRGQSFASGVSGVLSCGCGRCRKAFLEKGLDLDDVRHLYEQCGDSFFDILSWPADGEFLPVREPVRLFFEIREQIIAGAAAELGGYFRNKGMTVGLDLFAPVISRLAGQNYAMLSACADFIKPMLYRRTAAPAGIGYEYSLFEKHASGAAGRIPLTMDKAFLDSQLEVLRNVPCAVCPGIEINFHPELVQTDTAYITESLAAVKAHGFGGASLCWNILQAPEAHFSAAACLPG